LAGCRERSKKILEIVTGSEPGFILFIRLIVALDIIIRLIENSSNAFNREL
jgi:hypothetical protein